MAILKKKGIISSSLSGTLGGELVFRVRRNGLKTVVAVPPTEMGEPTEQQVQQRDRFKRAVEYAKQQMLIPALKARYAALAKTRKKPSAFSMAVIDFFSAPKIGNIDLAAYAGAVGNTITIAASDDFEVSQVSVTIVAQNGTTLETGSAVRQANSAAWTYTATAANATVAGTKFIVVATDLSGNQSTVEKVIA